MFDFNVPKFVELLFSSKKLWRSINFVVQFIELFRCCKFKILCLELIWKSD